MIPKNDLLQLQLDAETWYGDPKTKESTIGKFLHKYGETWYVKTALAVLFIFAHKWMLEFMNPDPLDDGPDDDDY